MGKIGLFLSSRVLVLWIIAPRHEIRPTECANCAVRPVSLRTKMRFCGFSPIFRFGKLFLKLEK